MRRGPEQREGSLHMYRRCGFGLSTVLIFKIMKQNIDSRVCISINQQSSDNLLYIHIHNIATLDLVPLLAGSEEIVFNHRWRFFSPDFALNNDMMFLETTDSLPVDEKQSCLSVDQSIIS